MAQKTPWNKGKIGIWSEEQIANNRAKHLGKHTSARQKLVASLIHKGNKWALGNNLSIETRKKMSESRKGDKNYQWISDRTLLKDDHRDRGGQLHREWSMQVKNRDGWRCKIDNHDCEGRVVAHHILGWSSYPELRYEINNGITLCHAHHPLKRAEEKLMIPIFRGLLGLSIGN